MRAGRPGGDDVTTASVAGGFHRVEAINRQRARATSDREDCDGGARERAGGRRPELRRFTFGIVTCRRKAPELTPMNGRRARVLGRGAGPRGDSRRAAAAALADDVVVRALYSGISRGTEALVFHGRVPAERIPAHARAVSSRRVSGAGQVRLRERRQRRARPAAICRAGTCSCCIRIRRATSCRQRPSTSLPDDVPPARAVLAANLETAINGLWDAGRTSAIASTVIGAGTVGCLVAWLAGRMPGCDVELVDVNPARAPIAQALGVRFAAPEQAAATAPTSSSTRADRPRASRSRCASPAFEATIVEMSWYGDQVGAAAARRGVSRAAADAEVVAGRHRGAVAARALGPAPADAARAVAARRPGARRADHRRERRSRRCREVMAQLADGAGRHALPSDPV